MAKKTVRRKAARTTKSKLVPGKYLTFPVIAVFAFAVLALLTVFMITKPMKSVMGDSTKSGDQKVNFGSQSR